MKKFIALALAAVSLNALALDFKGKSMVDFDGSSVVGALSWTDSKDSGSVSKNKDFYVAARYAYTLTNNIQLGTYLAYGAGRQSQGSVKTEGYTALVGGYYNFDTDFKKSLYVSAHIGLSWNREFAGSSNSSTETLVTRYAVGKRYPLFSENFTYSPELVYTVSDDTKKTTTEYTNEFAFKFLNFSLFF